MDMIRDFQRALNYIEDNLLEEIEFCEAAKFMNISTFYFQKIFSVLCQMGVGEYVRYRRLSLAGRELYNADEKILDVALKYGYDTPEGFTRAFTKFHGASPTAVKKGLARPKCFDRLSVTITLKGGSFMDYRIEKKPAFRVAEKRSVQKIDGQKDLNTIPKFWGQSHNDGTVSKLLDITNDKTFIFGICYSNPHDKTAEFEYSIAAKIGETEAVPEGFTENFIPERTWMIFECVGKMPDAIQQTFHRICTECLPTSEYEPTYEFDVEAYSAGDMNDENYRSEIWVPVNKK